MHFLYSQEEKEKRLEEMFDTDLDNTLDRYAPKEEVPEEGAVALAGKRTQETLTKTDSIIEALDIAEAELKRISEHEVMSHFIGLRYLQSTTSRFFNIALQTHSVYSSFFFLS